ncbi:MAG: polyprenyl diphosphate synthase [Candidatus Harrisonbacteria bacterium]|nr:polyprenyl diphosphate synthase [Candidatus Harrisonbacteria bacterium]
MSQFAHTLNHIAIIPDGNRRWAASQKRSIWGGYKKGAAQFQSIMRSVFNRQIRYLTFWAASRSNLEKRSKQEVQLLIKLLRSYIKDMLASDELEEKQISVNFQGKGLKLSNNKELQDLAAQLEEKTKGFQKHVLTILFGYDGKEEMLSAAANMQKLDKLGEEELRRQLWTGALPDVDLVIRTGDEPHNSSGFMMWHTAESELYFSDRLWPAFDEAELDRALASYTTRRRKMGA